MTTTSPRKILVTSALPYANGPIHLGHMVEYIQTDIWVRAQKQQGHACYYVCADDAHGTPIMLRAEAEGITPEQLIERISQEHQQDFADFLIGFDNYYSTHSDENRQLSTLIYQRLLDQGAIFTKTIEQLFDPEKQMFLPDRYVKGTCPKCQAEDQYGDNCEQCGATYAPTELLNPYSSVSGATPVLKQTEHAFFDLPAFHDTLGQWLQSERLQPAVANKLREWYDAGLQSWDITRDAPYFGFEIPGLDQKYFYVWMDAPVGYMASFKNLCAKKNLNFDEFWAHDSQTELYHFIGKDIVNFHGLFWPAELAGAGFRIPTAIYAHGFLTVDGKKMSKSRGTFVMARTYLEHLNPEYLRYYFAAKLSSGVDDIDLNLEDFVQRVNSDLIGKFVNIASRTANFIAKKFDGLLLDRWDDESTELYQQFARQQTEIAALYESREYNQAMRTIMALADKANEYIAVKAPWVMAKDETKQAQLHQVTSLSVNLFRVLATYLSPVLPTTAIKVAAFLNVKQLNWQDVTRPLTNHTIQPFKPLMQRIEPALIEKMTEASKVAVAKQQAPLKATVASANAYESVADEITIDDFVKLDLRVAQIMEAKEIPAAKKLYELTLDLGFEQRTVFAGIKAAYQASELTGRKVIMIANLKPRKMKFGVSQGMVLAAGSGGEDIYLLSPDDPAQPGMKVS